MGYFLLDNRNPHNDNFYTSRRRPAQIFVIHCTAGLEDLDTKDDHSAEATARYASTTTRKASWHSGSDTDSFLQLLPDDFVAFHCVGYNTAGVGHEISKKHTNWLVMPPEWIEKSLHMAALSVAPRAKRLGIPFTKITKTEVDRGVRGFISHGELDRDRRSDPGWVTTWIDTFPWERFFELCREVVDGATQPPPPPRPGMPRTVRRGSDDEATVELLQKRLINHGHAVKVDGDFGAKTEAAVKVHQRAWHLDDDGVVGPATWPSLLMKGPKGT